MGRAPEWHQRTWGMWSRTTLGLHSSRGMPSSLCLHPGPRFIERLEMPSAILTYVLKHSLMAPFPNGCEKPRQTGVKNLQNVQAFQHKENSARESILTLTPILRWIWSWAHSPVMALYLQRTSDQWVKLPQMSIWVTCHIKKFLFISLVGFWIQERSDLVNNSSFSQFLGEDKQKCDKSIIEMNKFRCSSVKPASTFWQSSCETFHTGDPPFG